MKLVKQIMFESGYDDHRWTKINIYNVQRCLRHVQNSEGTSYRNNNICEMSFRIIGWGGGGNKHP